MSMKYGYVNTIHCTYDTLTCVSGRKWGGDDRSIECVE
jgi:hypothetical protein